MFVLREWFIGLVLWVAAGAPTPSDHHILHRYYVHEGREHEGLFFADVLKSVLETQADLRCSVLLFSEAAGSLKTLLDGLVPLSVLHGMGVFEVEMDAQDTNGTQTQLFQAVARARQLRWKYWCVTMVVLSDDPAFLGAFAEWALLMPSSNLLTLTRLPARLFQENKQMRTTFSTMNAIIGIFREKSKRFTLYYLEPYSSPEDGVTRLADWSPQEGLIHTSHIPLFFDKYTRFRRRPTLTIATEAFHTRQTQKEDGRGRDYVSEYLSQGMNFEYRYGITADGTFGSKQDDGSWSGMIGAVSRKEADFALGPFSLSPSRAEVVDFTFPLSIQYCVIMGGLWLPQVDPWAFLFPLGPMVHAAILVALTVVPSVMVLLYYCASFSSAGLARVTWPATLFEMLRVLLLQDNRISGGTWWWRRLAMCGWMLTALVLIKSYAGNLMSVLTVRYIQQPYQTLSDVVRDPSINMIWQTNTSNVQFIRSAESGIYRDVADAEKSGRTKFEPIMNFYWSIDKLVRRRDHVLIDVELLIMMMIGQDFTYTGRCDFYISKEKFLPVMLSLIGQKNSLIVPAFNKRIMSLTEAGLYYLWVKSSMPNYTSCATSPTKITVSTTLALENLWGMFVVLAGGYVVGLFVLVVEVLTSRCCTTCTPSQPHQH